MVQGVPHHLENSLYMSSGRESDVSPIQRDKSDFSPPNSESNSWLNSSHRTGEARQDWLSATKPTVQVCQLFERGGECKSEPLSKLCDSLCGRNQPYSQQFALKGEALFLAGSCTCECGVVMQHG